MLTILVLFVGLTLATAVIAYWSDNLGKKLGKKRVSLWGMRPRTTATFLTIASSWLIMVFTLSVMLGLFKPLRQALLRYDEVKANEKTLSRSAEKLTGQVGNLNGQLATLTEQTTTLKLRVQTASGRLKLVGEKLQQSRQAAASARREQESAEKESVAAKASAAKALASERAAVAREQKASENLQTVTNQRDATQQQRDNAQREFKAAQGELKRANAEVKAASERVKMAGERVKVAQSKAKAADEQLKKAQENLATVRNDLAAVKTSERAALTNAQTANRNAETSKRVADAADKRASDAKDQAFKSGKQILEAQAAVDQLRAQQAKLIDANRGLANLSANLDRAVKRNEFVEVANIRVPVGFTLAARTFEPGLSFTESMQRLHSLFNYAANTMTPGTEDYLPILPGAQLQLAVQYVSLDETQKDNEVVSIQVNPDEIYNNLATAISRSQTPLSVRLVADRNHLDGDKSLDARFIIVPQRLALPADTELASATFDRKLSDAQLFSALLKLTDTGREVAKKNGVTPPLSPEVPDFFAPGANERIFEALRKISAMDGRARVRLLTDKEISTTDQLSIRFDVEPLAPTTAALSTNSGRKAPA